jgi:hypothetical protein
MATYTVRFNTTISLAVRVEADDPDSAADAAWQPAEDYLNTVYGNSRDVLADATLDGIGADEVEEIESAKSDT